MSNSLLLTKSNHPDETTEQKQYHSALGNFLPERAAGFNSFCCLTESLCVWGDEWLRHKGRAAGTHIPVPEGFYPLRIWITPWDKKTNNTPSSPLHSQQSPNNCGFIHRTVFKQRCCLVWEREFLQFLTLIFNLWCKSQPNKSNCAYPCSGKG